MRGCFAGSGENTQRFILLGQFRGQHDLDDAERHSLSDNDSGCIDAIRNCTSATRNCISATWNCIMLLQLAGMGRCTLACSMIHSSDELSLLFPGVLRKSQCSITPLAPF